jgi:hypothetical protein
MSKQPPLDDPRWVPLEVPHGLLTQRTGDRGLAAHDLTALLATQVHSMRRYFGRYRDPRRPKLERELLPFSFWDEHKLSWHDGLRIRHAQSTQTADVEAFITTHDGKRNLYFSVNPLRREMSKKATKEDVKSIEYAIGDCDPNEGENSEEAKQRYLTRIRNGFEPKPSAIIDSGNGIQLLVKLLEPVTLGEPIWVEKQVKNKKTGETQTEKELKYTPEDQAKIDDVEARSATLMKHVGAKPGTQNVDRILRLPGTTNLPNAKKRKDGRVVVPARLIEVNGTAVRLEDLPKDETSGKAKKSAKAEAKVETDAKTETDAKAETSSKKKKPTKPVVDLGEIKDIAPDDPRLSKLSEQWSQLGYKGVGIKPDRSASVLAFACECVRVGVPDDAIASCLMHWEIGEHCREQADVERAIERAIEQAHEEVENDLLFHMNQKHFVVPISGKTRVVTWGPDPNFPGRETIIQVAAFDDFKALQDKYRHKYTIINKRVGSTTAA